MASFGNAPRPGGISKVINVISRVDACAIDQFDCREGFNNISWPTVRPLGKRFKLSVLQRPGALLSFLPMLQW
jgi:hypothetical protein